MAESQQLSVHSSNTMNLFSEITELDPQALELLEASGYSHPDAIKGLSLVDLTKELNKTNILLDIVAEEITTSKVKQWLQPIEKRSGEVEDDTPEINRENIIAVADLISSPYAIPISKKFINENGLDIEKLPAGGIKFVSEAQAIKHIAVASASEFRPLGEPNNKSSNQTEDLGESQPEPTTAETSAPADSSTESEEEARPVHGELPHLGLGAHATPTQAELDRPTQKKRMLKMEQFMTEGSHVAPLQRGNEKDIVRTTLAETNKGVDPSSRRYIRGVLHSYAGPFKVATYAYILAQLCFFLTFVGGFLVIYNKEKFWWAMFSPILFLIGLFLFFVLTRGAQCPICRQRQFTIRTCLRHRNAHHWPVIGYMLPTALHIILFKWFRCIYCGTSVRLKK